MEIITRYSPRKLLCLTPRSSSFVQGVALVESAHGIDALDELHYHGPPDLAQHANVLVDRFYGEVGFMQTQEVHGNTSMGPPEPL